jgi:aconitate hydratase
MASTYVQNPPYFHGLGDLAAEAPPVADIRGARPLALLGDSVTTDHISPAGSIKEQSPAGEYLIDHQVPVREFNSYGSRRGNHEVMMRGTFANIRIRNELAPGTEAVSPVTCPLARSCRTTTPHEVPGRGGPTSSSAARSTHRLVARLGAKGVSAGVQGVVRGTFSASTAPTWSAWACCR